MWFSFLDLAASFHCVTSRDCVKDSSTELLEKSCWSTTSGIRNVFFCWYIFWPCVSGEVSLKMEFGLGCKPLCIYVAISKVHISLWDRIHLQSFTSLHQMCFKLKPLMFGDWLHSSINLTGRWSLHLTVLTQVPGSDCLGGLPRQKLSQFKHPESWGRYWTDDACTPLI